VPSTRTARRQTPPSPFAPTALDRPVSAYGYDGQLPRRPIGAGGSVARAGYKIPFPNQSQYIRKTFRPAVTPTPPPRSQVARSLNVTRPDLPRIAKNPPERWNPPGEPMASSRILQRGRRAGTEGVERNTEFSSYRTVRRGSQANAGGRLATVRRLPLCRPFALTQTQREHAMTSRRRCKEPSRKHRFQASGPASSSRRAPPNCNQRLPLLFFLLSSKHEGEGELAESEARRNPNGLVVENGEVLLRP